MSKSGLAIFSALIVSIIFLCPLSGVLAAPITTNVALPVRKGGFLFRTQAKWLRANGGSALNHGEVDVLAFQNVLIYGATPDLALFAVVPYVFIHKEFSDPLTGENIERNDSGIGDATLLGRYTVYARDYPSGTARFAVFGGVKLPTGSDDLEPITTDSVDFTLGGVTTVTWDFSRHEFDADVVYRINTKADDFEKGDELRYDLAYLFRVYPWTLPDIGAPNSLYIVVELNGVSSKRSQLNGEKINDTGGHTLFISPGLQFATKRFMLEIGIQLPAFQNLNGDTVETDFILVSGIRVNLP